MLRRHDATSAEHCITNSYTRFPGCFPGAPHDIGDRKSSAVLYDCQKSTKGTSEIRCESMSSASWGAHRALCGRYNLTRPKKSCDWWIGSFAVSMEARDELVVIKALELTATSEAKSQRERVSPRNVQAYSRGFGLRPVKLV